MLTRIGLALCLLAGVAAWSQEANHADSNPASADDLPLLLPPPVSGQAYVTAFEGAEQSNYLRGGVTFTGAYSSNVSLGSIPVSDVSYSMWPTIALDKTTYRSHLMFDYAPGFTLYQKTTAYNQVDQNLTANWSYRFTPNLTTTVSEVFQKTSNLFNQPNPLATTTVSGSVPTSNLNVIAPLAEMNVNTTAAQLIYQTGAGSMIGGQGTYGTLSYPNPDQVPGLFDSRSASGSFFYSTQVREHDYFGVEYQYQDILSFQSNSPSSTTQIQTMFAFYTMYLRPNWSVSVSAGPQYYSSNQSLFPSASGWQPMAMISTSWRGVRSNVAASYAHTVGGGGGLNGTFGSDSLAASFSRQITRNWSAGASASYSRYQNLTPQYLFSSPNGHTFWGAASLQRTFRDNIGLQFGYSWTQQSYFNYTTPYQNPDVNRVFVTLSYTFSRPLH